FSLGTDPVRLGLVASLNRLTGNMTGVYFFQSELGAKRLGLLHEVVPKATVIGMLVNPNFAEAEFHAKQDAGGRTLTRSSNPCRESQHGRRLRYCLLNPHPTKGRRALPRASSDDLTPMRISEVAPPPRF